MSVAPPRGERGLKHHNRSDTPTFAHRRSPSWGAWIETILRALGITTIEVAPPRGERGLKHLCIIY